MRTTTAYIASAGTAAVMLGAAVAMLVLVGGFVAFGSWPGSDSQTAVDQVLIESISSTPDARKVAVRSDAVAVTRRDTRQAVRDARTRSAAGVPVTRVRGLDTTRGAPTTRTPAGSTTPSTPGEAVEQITTDVTNPVQQGVQDVTNDVQQGVQNTTTQVQQGVENTTTQVQEVVDQVVGGSAPQVAETLDKTIGTVNDATKAVTDTAGSLLGR